MLHIHRQILGLNSFRPVILAQKVKGTWGGPIPHVIPRSAWRFASRAGERMLGTPWQISAGEAKAFERILEEERCSLLHIFFGNSAIHFLPLIRKTRLPVVVSFHGSDVTGSMASCAYASARKELFSRVALVPCRSQDLADKATALGCPVEKTRILRTALPPIDFSQRNIPDDGAWMIIQAARLVPKKGIATALQAFALFHQKFPQARYIIAGIGPEREKLEALSVSLGLQGAVDFVGFLPSGTLLERFRDAHIYLHPSEVSGGDVEGIPNALLEAMASGLPPVTTRHGGIPEVVQDSTSGLLCPEHDPQALASALLRLTENPSLYTAMGRAASDRAQSLFSPENQSTAISQIYREALTGGKLAT